ncbi:transportin-PC [Trametes versicolor FP-101664 SS1]|uniref:transportin-PC n=1 Tax=Trametes versicolor (strain FP-101664) TaxID=717944 RepID=UPI00046220E4|nr:transportin-PC [Trametes versicolor FP-101664 SS1]EIW58924.1 transportin-PC [Trametes versicolor FP-101664 SS1]
MASWTPRLPLLTTLLQTLRQATGTNAALLSTITQKLQIFGRREERVAYLAYILSSLPEEDDRIRIIAGHLLKDIARSILHTPPDVLTFAKSAVLVAVKDPSIMVCHAAAQAVVAFLGILEPRNWPECLQQLVHMLEPGGDQQEAALGVLKQACDKYPEKLDLEIDGSWSVKDILPMFIDLSDHPNAKVRAQAIACLSSLASIGCDSLFERIDAFIACLLKRASDEDPAVHRHVCQTLVLLLASRPEKLMPEMVNVAGYMLYSAKDKHQDVALQACDFWLTFAEIPDLAPNLRPFLAKVSHVLLDRMVHNDDDLLRHECYDDDVAVHDECAGIEPRPWNLRQYAAAALDALAVRFGADLLNVLLEPLQTKLRNDDWLQCESGILALGAIEPGCIDAIKPHLPTLVPYLFDALSHPQPLMRSNTCWTLGRYARWCSQPISPEHTTPIFVPTLQGLLRMMIDDNQHVQKAACSAFAALAEEAGPELAPYLELVLRQFLISFEKYANSNILVLYDAIETLADAVGSALQSPTYVEILMPSLLERWSKLKDDNDELKLLLQCLASVTIAMGPTVLPYATPIFDRCHAIVHNFLLQYKTSQQDPEMDRLDRSLIATFDILCGLIQGLGMELEQHIMGSQPNLFELLIDCMKHPYAAVRQSGFALVGIMSKNCFPLLRPQVSRIMQCLTVQLNPGLKLEFISVCNNAAWVAGEIALRFGHDEAEFRQWVHPLVSQLISILRHSKAPPNLLEDAAVSIGRIGLMHPALVAPLLPEFAHAWCQALYEIPENEEKDSASRGLCTLVQMNPAGIKKSLLCFCDAIVQWKQPSPELNDMFQHLLNGFKQTDAVDWAVQVVQFPPATQEALAARYGV